MLEKLKNHNFREKILKITVLDGKTKKITIFAIKTQKLQFQLEKLKTYSTKSVFKFSEDHFVFPLNGKFAKNQAINQIAA